MAREPRAVASETRHPASACVTCSLACSLVRPLVRSFVRSIVRPSVRTCARTSVARVFLYVSLPLPCHHQASSNLCRRRRRRHRGPSRVRTSVSGTFGAYLLAPGTSFLGHDTCPREQASSAVLSATTSISLSLSLSSTFRSSRSLARLFAPFYSPSPSAFLAFPFSRARRRVWCNA